MVGHDVPKRAVTMGRNTHADIAFKGGCPPWPSAGATKSFPHLSRYIQLNACDMQRSNGVSIPEGAVSGVVRSFVESKTYGFIDGDDGESYFVHIKEVQGGVFPWLPGSRFGSSLNPLPRGLFAKNQVFSYTTMAPVRSGFSRRFAALQVGAPFL